MQHPSGLLSDRVNDFGNVVPGAIRKDSTKEVEIIFSIRIPHMSALATDEFQGFVVVQREPTRHHLAVPAQKLGLRCCHIDLPPLDSGHRCVERGGNDGVNYATIRNVERASEHWVVSVNGELTYPRSY